MITYNLPDRGSKEWYSSPLYPAVADLDRRMGKGSTDITALQAAVAAAQASADAANAVKPYWHGYLAANVTLGTTGSNQDITTWTPDITSGGFLYSAGNLTLPVITGRWRITAVLAFDPNATTAGGRLCQIYPGTAGGNPLITGGATANAYRLVSPVAIKSLPLTSGFQFRVSAFQDSGVNTITVSGSVNKNVSYLQAEYLGP